LRKDRLNDFDLVWPPQVSPKQWKITRNIIGNRVRNKNRGRVVISSHHLGNGKYQIFKPAAAPFVAALYEVMPPQDAK
jgi:hypothetical protein